MEKDIVNGFAKKQRIVDIAKNIDTMALWRYAHASELKYSMENYSFDDDTFQRIYNLAEEIWLKDSGQACLAFFIEGICRLVSDGKTIDELAKLKKWELLEMIRK